MPTAPRSVRVALVDGRVLHAREWSGDDELPICLLIHGLGDSSRVWDRAAQMLAARFRVVAPDLPGHGESSWRGDGDYTLFEQAHDLLQFTDRLGVRRAVVVGHSWGGQIAIELTAHREFQTLGLVLVDSGPELDPAALGFIAQTYIAAHRTYSTIAEYEDLLASTRPWTESATLSAYASHSLRRVAAGWTPRSDPRVCEGMDIGRTEVVARLWELLACQTWPSLAIRGAFSGFICPAVADRIACTAPDCELKALETGHAVMLDNPPAFTAALMDFVLRVHGLQAAASSVA